MRVRPLARAEAMSFMTTRLRQVRAADRLASERGELPDVERERVGDTAIAARRSVQAGRGRIYLTDTVLLVEADDAAALSERIESLRLEGRGLGLELEVATFRLADAWRAALPGPAPSAARRAQPRLRARSPRACSTRRRTCTSRRGTCTGGHGPVVRRSCSIGSPTRATTRSSWGRPGPARRCSRAPR